MKLKRFRFSMMLNLFFEISFSIFFVFFSVLTVFNCYILEKNTTFSKYCCGFLLHRTEQRRAVQFFFYQEKSKRNESTKELNSSKK